MALDQLETTKTAANACDVPCQSPIKAWSTEKVGQFYVVKQPCAHRDHRNNNHAPSTPDFCVCRVP